ncbi:hypothetical protein FNV43_RR09242 [Rhamnella rubrinervis]|uniref:Uncharacterized protein n=1 Tax=Rhamnella rubrinervis TaxID=2594499 RepID=A0A8K0HAW2_9ROSA|nr:hypothetical protein FNV43_RR09242 [Rhamnella rubrinervis]
MRRPCWAKHNPVISACRTCKSACRIILWITISIWAPRLEEPRETCGSTATLALCAAIFIGFKHRTRVMTPSGGPQLVRALSLEISGAPNSPTPTRSWTKLHRNAATATGAGSCPDCVMAFVANHKGGCIGGDEEECEEEEVEYQGALHGF